MSNYESIKKQPKMEKKYRCKICGKGYAMSWAKDNHEKLCIEREKSEERNDVIEL